ncbi:hypothetical protein CVT24_009339 [Panaeolus cyanescens]|uniref:DUF1295-domain-containing protein n=1 Tax=Panaeolus cyanescens TaxID=181874 RepID=A0A409Y852_9AGAR|nr:hypothetical protein CVT24_009339 [Panaeolus cyanescens]
MTLFHLPAYLDWPAQFCLLSTGVTWVASLITSNVSQVDRLWTFLPTIYSAYYAFLPLLPNEQPALFVPYAPKELGWRAVTEYSPRALLMFTLIFVWMCRRAKLQHISSWQDEDYRWAVLRKQLPPWLFQVTNLTFIAFTQNVLLLLLGLPTYVAAVLQPHESLSTSDLLLSAFAVVILALEFTADNQQYAFHSYKHHVLALEKGDSKVEAYDEKKQWPGARLSWTRDDAKRGFVTRGLWRYSRHPNFTCEQSFWWVMTLMPLMAPAPPNLPLQSELPPLQTILVALVNPELYKPLVESLKASLLPSVFYLVPGIALSALFFSSTMYTESITKNKYTKAYDAYQKRVAMFAPTGTIVKWLKLKLFGSTKDQQWVEQLVWGNPSNGAPKEE